MHNHKMHIACPNCQAVYDVPENKLVKATVLRCHLCKHSWAVDAPASKAPIVNAQKVSRPAQPTLAKPTASPVLQPEKKLAPAQDPFQLSPHDPLVKSTGKSAHNGSNILLASAVLGLTVLTAALLARHGIVKAWPASSAFFKAIGIS